MESQLSKTARSKCFVPDCEDTDTHGCEFCDNRFCELHGMTGGDRLIGACEYLTAVPSCCDACRLLEKGERLHLSDCQRWQGYRCNCADDMPHASDCAKWCGEECDCVFGKAAEKGE